MMTVVLGGKKAASRVAVVDDSDYEVVNNYSWHIHTVKNSDLVYAQHTTVTRDLSTGKYSYSSISMHQLITGFKMTDHKDGNGLNNQRYNLRDVTPSQNQSNRNSIYGKSTYLGVCWHKGQRKWAAGIVRNRNKYWLGAYDSEIDAAKARDAKAIELFGEFARLNFPGGVSAK